ncbi:thioredoxin-like protein [Basidiobolus meristosporus CBS 931.73]|uniref:Thioredoxin-like protein n=1 Tax=Basidiobolus meristosporus CBS 931.73 TaxID=1314790 RepID=A0A1Y1YBS3_9FUNG|nr:thioredoxin-like protein [Basidiobolus meristosporus CBS 931.73]|eukprot:ORX95449.1 thioredoxin-like protein [Basidiobolus meristosporus CBS 931.73]
MILIKATTLALLLTITSNICLTHAAQVTDQCLEGDNNSKAAAIKIYSFEEALWPGPVRLTLAEKSLRDVEVIEVNLAVAENLSPEYLKINQHGTVPALVDTNTGMILDDSTTITKFLDENFPGTELYPAQELSNIDRWIKEAHNVDGNLLAISPANAGELKQKKAFAEKFLGDRLKALAKFMKKQDIALYREKQKEMQSVLNAYQHPEQAQPLYDSHNNEWKKAEAFLNRLDAQLAIGPYVVGKKYTLADVHTIPLLLRLKSIKGDAVLKGRQNLQRYLYKVASRENFKAVYGAL